MGIITGLLFLPVTGPVKAFRFLVERLHEEAQAALRDEGRAFAELIDLSMRHGAGQLSDAEYAEQEAVLLGRLSSIRDHRTELLQAGQEVEAQMDEGEALDDEALEEDESLGDESLGDESLEYESREDDALDAEPVVEEEVR